MTINSRSGVGLVPIVAGTAILTATVAAWLLVPVRQEAYTLLKVSDKPPTVMANAAAAPEEFAMFKRTQVQLILSNRVLQGALREAEINRLSSIQAHSDDPVSWLREQLIIDYPDDSEIMRVSMRGVNGDQLIKIVNQIVAVYMKEIVQRDRDQRLEHENKLEKSYTAMAGELQKQQGSLHTLESLHKTSGSDAARLRKEIAVKELDALLARRSKVADKLEDNAMQLMLEKARRDIPPQVRTAEAAGEGEKTPADTLDLVLLEKQKEFLEARLARIEEDMAKQQDLIETMETFSATVAIKQEDLRAMQRITNDLRDALDRARVEKLAPERITILDPAALTGGHGDQVRKNSLAGLAVAIGTALIALGMTVRLRASRSKAE